MNALAVACAAAERAGVPVRDPVVLDERSNVIVRLAPEGPVARVAGLTAAARSGGATFARELAVAGALHLAGAPVVAPFEPGGPYEVDGRAVTLWALADGAEETDGAAAGRALRACHEALEVMRPSVEMPSVAWLLDEAAAVAARSGLSREDEALVRRALDVGRAGLDDLGAPAQLVHGDAGLGNVLAGGRWTDWEDVSIGPVAWDLACLVATARMTGLRADRAEAALAAYGADVPDAAVLARGAQTTAWSAFTKAQSGRDSGRLALRLAWLRERA